MDIDVFSAFSEVANLNGIIFYYHGTFSQNVISTMGDALKQRIESQDTNSKTSRKLFSSFVEMVQNALHYSPATHDSRGGNWGTVAVGKLGGKFFIVCGNLVEKQYVDRIREKLDPLKKMSLEEIKLAYREKLNSDSSGDSVSKGAGLGFLTLARDAAEPIEYTLIDQHGHESEFSYFYLKAVI